MEREDEDYRFDDQRASSVRRLQDNLINYELLRRGLDIAALQETRLPETGSLPRKMSALSSGAGKQRTTTSTSTTSGLRGQDHVVLSMIEPGKNMSARTHPLCFNTTDEPVTLRGMNPPTLYSSQEVKDVLYGQLLSAADNVPASDSLVLFGDFIAHVGADAPS